MGKSGREEKPGSRYYAVIETACVRVLGCDSEFSAAAAANIIFRIGSVIAR